MTDTHEARVALRLPITLRVRLTWRGGVVTCYSANVSERGMFVETATDVPVDAAVGVTFTYQRDGAPLPVTAEGTVVHRIEPDDTRGLVTGVGIRFESFDRGEDDLSRLVSERLWEIRATQAPREGDDRRLFPRVNVGLPIFWGRQRPPSREAFLRNLSASGGYVLETREPMPRGERIHLWFELPIAGAPQPVRTVAKVARLVTDRRIELVGVGLEFEVSSADRAVIEHFVAQRLGWESALAGAAPGSIVP